MPENFSPHSYRAEVFWRRFNLIVLGIPIFFLLMLVDAFCIAWCELSDDWRDTKSAIKEIWRGE